MCHDYVFWYEYLHYKFKNEKTLCICMEKLELTIIHVTRFNAQKCFGCVSSLIQYKN